MAKKMMKMSAAKLAQAKRAIKAKFKLAKRKLVVAERKAEGYVKHNPKKAVGMAAAVGAAIGAATAYALMRRRK